MKNLSLNFVQVFSLIGLSFFLLFTSCQKDDLATLAQAEDTKKSIAPFIDNVLETANITSMEDLLNIQKANVSYRNNFSFVPTSLNCGSIVNGNTTGSSNELTSSENPCSTHGYSYNAPDNIYAFFVPRPQTVSFRLYNLEVDLDLFIFSLTDQGDIGGCKASSLNGDNNDEVINVFLSTGAYIVAVDGFLSFLDGSYTLSVACDYTGGGTECCDPGDVYSWLDVEPCEEVKCCFLNGTPVIDVDGTSCTTDGVGRIYTCDGDEIAIYGTIAGIPKPTLDNCTPLSGGTGGGDCNNLPSGCEIITCTPGTPTAGDGFYNCPVGLSFDGDFGQIDRWEVNGVPTQIEGATLLYVPEPGTTTICCYYYCGEILVSCCREIYCPFPDENDDCVITEDDFEDYVRYRRIAEQAPNKWRTWHPNGAGTRQDAYVGYTTSGNQVLYVLDENNGTQQDVVRKLGNKTAGTYKITFDMWVGNGDRGYFNLQSSQEDLQGGGYWSIYFDDNETGRIKVGSQTVHTFSYPQGEWFEVSLLVDLDWNWSRVDCRIDDNSSQSVSYHFNPHLGGINFYAVDDARYAIDDILMQDADCLDDDDLGLRAESLNGSIPSIEETELKTKSGEQKRSLTNTTKVSVPVEFTKVKGLR